MPWAPTGIGASGHKSCAGDGDGFANGGDDGDGYANGGCDGGDGEVAH